MRTANLLIDRCFRGILTLRWQRTRVRGVWTGAELIIVAGSTGGAPVTGNGELALSDGAAYDPVTGTWRPIFSKKRYTKNKLSRVSRAPSLMASAKSSAVR